MSKNLLLLFFLVTFGFLILNFKKTEIATAGDVGLGSLTRLDGSNVVDDKDRDSRTDDFSGVASDSSSDKFSGFNQGVLAINTNKSVYLPEEKAYLQIAVLKEDGHTVCDANLELEITSPGGGIINPEVQKSGECGPDNITDVPDYYSLYQVNGPGTYQMKLKNLDNGYEITDSFEVKESVPFDIERAGPTRIYFPVAYQMNFKVKANEDFDGEIRENVPASFEIKTNENLKVVNQNDTKKIVWQVDWKKGETYEFFYQFNAPDASPYLYFLGPLKISTRKSQFPNSSFQVGDRNGDWVLGEKIKNPNGTVTDRWVFGAAGEDLPRESLFEEQRQWQIAADVPVTLKPTTVTHPAYTRFTNSSPTFFTSPDNATTEFTGTQYTNVQLEDGNYAFTSAASNMNTRYANIAQLFKFNTSAYPSIFDITVKWKGYRTHVGDGPDVAALQVYKASAWETWQTLPTTEQIYTKILGNGSAYFYNSTWIRFGAFISAQNNGAAITMGLYTNYAWLEITENAPNVPPVALTVDDAPDPVPSGSNITFTGTWSDPLDTVKMYICKNQNCDDGFGKKCDAASCPSANCDCWCYSVGTTTETGTCDHSVVVADEGLNLYWMRVCDDENSCHTLPHILPTDGTFVGTAPNNAPVAESVVDSPDPVSIGIEATFTGTWSDLDSNEKIKMYICKDETCTDCNKDKQTGCWCYSLDWELIKGTGFCGHPVVLGDVGIRPYWLRVCDDNNFCHTLPEGGTFTVNPLGVKTVILRPDGIGGLTENQPFPPSTSNYADIKEDIPFPGDKDLSYVWHDLTGEMPISDRGPYKDLYSLQNISGLILPGSSINNVTVYIVVKNQEDYKKLGGYATIIKTNGEEFMGVAGYPTSADSWKLYSDSYNSNQYNGNNWTIADIDALQIGVALWGELDNVGSGMNTYGHCTQVFAIVDYSDPLPNSPPNVYSVTDAPDPVNVGSKIFFSGSWSDSNPGDSDKMYVCKDAACTKCNPTFCSGALCDCWCYSSDWNIKPDEFDTCEYIAKTVDAGDRDYWLRVCDIGGLCSSSLPGGTFKVDVVNIPPNATLVSDAPADTIILVGGTVTFTGSWTESDPGDQDRMFICMEPNCANCNKTDISGCWCSSGFISGTTSSCVYTAESAYAGSQSYWLGVCDDKPSYSCDLTPLAGGTFKIDIPVGPTHVFLYPIGVGSKTELSHQSVFPTPDCVSNWECVNDPDEGNPADDNDIVMIANPDGPYEDLYKIGPSGIPLTSEILSVTIHWRARKENDLFLPPKYCGGWPILNWNNVTAPGTQVPLTTSWPELPDPDFHQTWYKNPVTNLPWNPEELDNPSDPDNLQIGVKLSAPYVGNSFPLCSQVYAEVVYQSAGATPPADLYGYAWSERIGWISFNSKNCDKDGDNIMSAADIAAGAPVGCPPIGELISTYGVHLPITTNPLDDRDLSGYAWSENIGWIKFDPLDTPPANLFCELRPVYLSGNEFLHGFARACAGASNPNICKNEGGKEKNDNSGGWDGWICLDGATISSGPYGVILGEAHSEQEFSGWAWGGGGESSLNANVGWISFNHEDTLAPLSNYEVFFKPPNEAPDKPALDDDLWQACCSGSGIACAGCDLILNWFYDDFEDNPQQDFEIQISKDQDFLIGPTFNHKVYGSALPNYFVNLGPGQDDDSDDGIFPNRFELDQIYHWRVKTNDGIGGWSAWSDTGTFNTPPHHWPKVNFNFCPSNPRVMQPVQFCSVDDVLAGNQGKCSGDGSFCNLPGDCPVPSLPLPPQTCVFDCSSTSGTPSCLIDSETAPTPAAKADPLGDTTCYNDSEDPVQCPLVAFSWTFVETTGSSFSAEKNPTFQFGSAADSLAVLTVTDTDLPTGGGFTNNCSKDLTLTGFQLDLPIWIEVAPNTP